MTRGIGEARRAEGCERKGGMATLVCNEGVAADHTRPKNTLSAKPTPYNTPVHHRLLPAGGNESSIKRRYQCVTSSEFSLFLSLSYPVSLPFLFYILPFHSYIQVFF